MKTDSKNYKNLLIFSILMVILAFIILQLDFQATEITYTAFDTITGADFSSGTLNNLQIENGYLTTDPT